MITVYGSVYSRAAMVLVTLEMLELEYRLVQILPGSEQARAEAYLNLNPLGKVPTLTDGDFTLFETQAILYYLVRRYGQGKLWADDPQTEADILRWSLYISNQLEAPALAMLLQVKYRNANADPQIMQDSTEQLQRFLPLLERQLSSRDYLCNTLSIADIHGGLVLSWVKLAGFNLDDYPAVHRWIRSILALPAYKQLVANESRD